METLGDLLLKFGGLSSWLFILALPPQVYGNWQENIYKSGPRTTWWLFIAAYALFGTYMLLVGEHIVAAGQYAGGILSITVMVQSYIYKHAK
ncbi:MAG: hypothetical protein WD898_00145 [Candidatus Paceibacterota bacterium]